MEKLKILLATGVVTEEHKFRRTNASLIELLESTGRFEVKVMEEFRHISKATMDLYDAIFINYDGKSWPTDTAQTFGAETEENLYAYVRQGKGLLIFHSTVWGDDWPAEFRKMMGGCCLMSEGARRAPKGDFFVKNVRRDDPILQGLDEQYMVCEEDHFTHVTWEKENNVEVLCTVFDDVEQYKIAGWPPKHHPVAIPDGKLENMEGVNTDTAVVWKNTYGDGRVFVSSIGHGPDTWRRENFMAMLVRGLEWAATGTVTLDRPDRSGDKRLLPWPYYQG